MRRLPVLYYAMPFAAAAALQIHFYSQGRPTPSTPVIFRAIEALFVMFMTAGAWAGAYIAMVIKGDAKDPLDAEEVKTA